MLASYLALNLLLLIGGAFIFCFSFFQKRKQFSALLLLHYFTLGLVLFCTLLVPHLPGAPIFEPVAKVWSAPSAKSFVDDPSYPQGKGYLSLPGSQEKTAINTQHIGWGWLVFSALLALVAAIKLTLDLRALLKIRRQSFLVKNHQRIFVYANDQIAVPFSFWLPGSANVILPAKILANPKDLRIALAHELQHHRQHDTKWVYVLWLLRVVCFFHPVVHWWNRKISELQEFACDEALLGQRKVESRAYARCLLEVAETAFHQERIPACATGLTFLVERNLIKRRIESMLNPSTKKMNVNLKITFCAAVAALLVSTAFAAKALVQDRRIDLRQAQAMAEKARQNTNFPIVVNELVLAQLNRYIGTPEGRKFISDSLQRMENYREVVEGKIQHYRMPIELMAVPIMESGYQNLDGSENKTSGAAGLWQFVKNTARNYGLRVDEQVDERLNVELATDAAMRYLQSNYLRFKDWHLSLLAYNMGEGGVQRAMDRTGSRDAWELVRRGFENDSNYLARVMAAILILKNPEILE